MPRRPNDDETEWRVRLGPGGWALLEERAERVAVRVEPDESGRLRVREFHLLDSGQPITAERLRALRMAAIEQVLNLPEERAEIEKLLRRRTSLDVEAVVARFAAVDLEVAAQIRTAGTVTPGRLGTVHDKRGGAAASMSASGAVARGLRAPPQRGYPDEFYEQVATKYRAAVREATSGHVAPVEAIAAEAGVPRTTAARWVKEARRRGKLEPAPATGKVK